MLAFVIPLKPFRNSGDWKEDSKCLRYTLNSMLSQSDSSFHIFVVYHDMPLEYITNEKITYLKFPKDYYEFQKIEDGQEQLTGNSYLAEKDVEYLFDQGSKQMYGAKTAIEKGYSYIMCVDGDDIVSKNIVEYVSKQANKNEIGWYVDKGYFLIKNKDIYFKRPFGMNLYNGSTNIVQHQYINDFNIESAKLSEVNFFSSHAYLVTRLKQTYGFTLKPLPFYALIYVITNQNWRATVKDFQGKSIKSFLKFLIRKVYFKKSLVGDFDLESFKF